MLFQVFLIGFAMYLVFHVYKQYRAEKVLLSWFLMWFFFAVIVVVVALQPALTDFIASKVGVGRGADLVVYTSLALLFTAVLRHAAHLDRTDRALTELIRKIAIDNAAPPKKKDV